MQRGAEEKAEEKIITIPPGELAKGLAVILQMDNAHRLDFKKSSIGNFLQIKQDILNKKIHNLYASKSAKPLYTLFEVFYLLANQGIEPEKLNRKKYQGGLVTSKIYFFSEKSNYQRKFDQVVMLAKKSPLPELRERKRHILYLQKMDDDRLAIYTDDEKETKILAGTIINDLKKDAKLEFSEVDQFIIDKQLISLILSLSGFPRRLTQGAYNAKSAIHFGSVSNINFLHVWAHEQTHLICQVLYENINPEPRNLFVDLASTMMQEKKDMLSPAYSLFHFGEGYSKTLYAAELIARLFEFISMEGKLPALEDGVFSKSTIETMHILFAGVMEKLNNLKNDLLSKSHHRIQRIELYQLLLNGSEESIDTFLKYINPQNYKAYHLDPLVIAIDTDNIVLFKKCLEAGFKIDAKDKFGRRVEDYLSLKFIERSLSAMFEEKYAKEEETPKKLIILLTNTYLDLVLKYISSHLNLPDVFLKRSQALLVDKILAFDSYEKIKDFFIQNIKGKDNLFLLFHLFTAVYQEDKQAESESLKKPLENPQSSSCYLKR